MVSPYLKNKGSAVRFCLWPLTMENKIILPNYLNPYKIEDLTRIGNSNDGGYIVSKQDIRDSKYLISLGISFDYSFEKEFLKKNSKINIYTYDGSVGFRYFRKNIKHRVKKFLVNPNKKNLLRALSRLKFFLDFCIFFKLNLSNKIKHSEKFVFSNQIIFDDFENSYGYKPQFIEFKKIFSRNLNNVFLSIDIEGGEYDLLDEICGYSDKIIALNIEFHDVNKNLEKIKKFINNCNLLLIHTHINNFGPISDGIPTVLELSFSRKLQKINVQNYQLADYLPIVLDQKNNENGIDYSVTFK